MNSPSASPVSEEPSPSLETVSESHSHHRQRFSLVTERPGFLMLTVALLWFTSLPLAITNRNAEALLIYAVGLILCGFLMFWRHGASGQAARRPHGNTPAHADEALVATPAGATAVALAEIDATLRLVLNGSLSARVTLYEDRQLWHIANGLNYVFARLERSSESDATLQRAERQATAVIEGIRTLRSGGTPYWPRSAQTPLDRIIAELSPDDQPQLLDTASRYSFPTYDEHAAETAYDG